MSIPERIQIRFTRSLAAPMRALVLSTCLAALSACTGPVATPTPSAIILSEDLHFKWFPPNLSPKIDISLSAGRYTRSAVEWDRVYYESEGGVVSAARAGQPAVKAKGGIGYLTRKGRYFVWGYTSSITAQNAWLLISNMTEDGPLVRAYSGQVPKEFEPSLRIER
jgi:hypothetical protein